jgi:hypothetical protein
MAGRIWLPPGIPNPHMPIQFPKVALIRRLPEANPGQQMEVRQNGRWRTRLKLLLCEQALCSETLSG